MDNKRVWTSWELAAEVGLCASTLSRHVRLGTIPAPEVAIGRRKCFGAEQREVVLAFFAGRRRWSRVKGEKS